VQNTILDLLVWSKFFKIYANSTTSKEAKENLIVASKKMDDIIHQLVVGKNSFGKQFTVPDTAQSLLHLWRKTHKQEWRFATLGVLDDSGHRVSMILSYMRDTAENLLKENYVIPTKPIVVEEVEKMMNPIGICRHCNRVIELKLGMCPACGRKICAADVLDPRKLEEERKKKAIRVEKKEVEQVELKTIPSSIFLLNEATGRYECKKCGFAPFEAGITRDPQSRDLKKCPTCGFGGEPVKEAEKKILPTEAGKKEPSKKVGLFHRGGKKPKKEAVSPETIKIDEGPYRGISTNAFWPAEGGNARRSGCAPGLGAKKGKILWQLPLSPNLTAPPVIGRDRNIYIGTMGRGFFQITPEGQIGWVFIVEEDISSPACIDVDRNIYFSIPGKTYKLNPDGAPNWVVREGSDFSPVLDRNGNVYVISESHLVCIGNRGGIKWKASLGTNVGEVIFDLTPTIGPEGNIYLCTDHLLCFDPSGKRVFGAPLIKRGNRPTVDEKGNIYVGTENRLLAIRSDGGILWQKELRDYISTPAALTQNGNIIFGTLNAGAIYCASIEGAHIWDFMSGDSIIGVPSTDSQGDIYFSNRKGKLYCLNSRGRKQWEYSTKSLGFFGGGTINSSVAIGERGFIYASCQDGKLYAFE